MPVRPKRTLVSLAAAVLLAVTAPAVTGTAAARPQPAAPPQHFTGTLADGAAWIADVPADWNGTLLLFAHGFGPTVAANAPSPAVRDRLLAEGYALAGSSYDPAGSWWALSSAERDQFATIEAFGRAAGRPERTISVGQSMGGLVNAQIARDADGRVDGALGFCGLVAGGIDLSNYQLDAEHALARLLLPGEQLKLVDFASPAEATATADRLTAAVKAAQTTPQGRARIALAAAYLNLPPWHSGATPPPRHDEVAHEEQQYAWLAQGVLNFIEFGRYHIEQAVGGNPSGTKGVDYARLLAASAHAPQVRALYRTAGLDLGADLATLTRDAHITADPAAVRTAQRTSTAGQGLDVPLLNVHNIADQLVPVEQENAFADRVRAAADAPLLRQAYVARPGHCAFTTAEYVAAVHAMEHRLDTGRWDDRAQPHVLQRAAVELGLDGAAYVPYRPGELVGSRR
ncbi:alpha/beta hydrolase [Streptomyces sp. TRM66268-LWL]|uniref:Alpha/beta hydrolase n=1 Tax=Streptomyces polyasparticus TaxID=2767826 RepID=A0ABR7SW82_9ACTN|nr:alpha/beta hydrolase [Streptomyces polyasparticus]MBC9718766.1 alpha/beta hydrolase [Streptomyces polyasparticus]